MAQRVERAAGRLDTVAGPSGHELPAGAGNEARPIGGPGPSLKDSLRVDMLFRERGFWLFSTGHRLGDMRRLMRQYNRTVNSVYPNGAWFKGGSYGDAIQMAIPVEELNNPKFHGCLDRNP